MKRWLLSRWHFSLWLLAGICAHAAESEFEDPAALIDRYRYRIESTLKATKELRPEVSCAFCSNFYEGESKPTSPACRKTYKDFYKIKEKVENEKASDQVIKVNIAFGYMDYLKSVEDAYAATAFATQLTSPCKLKTNACGFRVDPDDAELYTKKVSFLGPDGVARKRTVQLRLRASSVTGDERQNRGQDGQPSDEQAEQTLGTREFFKEGLESADAVFYIGHARDGGGPDFGPPHVSDETHRTDYDWHHHHPDGRNLMTETLKAAERPAKIVGVFACYAKAHFAAALRKASASTGFILTNQAEFEATVGQAAASLDSILAMKCEADFQKSVDVIKNVNDVEIGSPSLDGLFRN